MSAPPRSGTDLRAELAEAWAKFDRLLAAYDAEMADLIDRNRRALAAETED